MLRGLFSPELKRYNIVIGKPGWEEFVPNTSGFLQVKCETEVEGIISKLKGIKQLVVDGTPGMTDNFIADHPDLEYLTVRNNSHLFCIFQKVSQICLRKLILWRLKNLKTICDGRIGIESFGQLRTLKVGECHRLTHVFLLASDKDFQQLEEIELSNCENMEVIFASTSQQAHEIKLSKLRILKLNGVSQFKSLSWNLKTGYYDIPTPLIHEKVVVTNLQQLDIHGMNVDMIWDNQPQKINGRFQAEPKESNYGWCEHKVSYQSEVGPNLVKTFSPWSRNLTKLVLYNCGNLEEVFPNSMIKIEGLKDETKKVVVFPVLEYLQLNKLRNLKRLSSQCNIEFPTLTTFHISQCPKVKAIFDDKIKVPNLEILVIYMMDNLEMTWELREDSIVHIRKCDSLEEISSPARINTGERTPTQSTQSEELCTRTVSFVNLDYMNVSSCKNLKYLCGKEAEEENEAHAMQFVFPRLANFLLYELPQLRTFYPHEHTVEMPELKRLELMDCWTPETEEDHRMQQPLFSVGNAFPRLEELVIGAKDLMMMWQGRDPGPLFQNFRTLYVANDGSLIYGDQKHSLHLIGEVKRMREESFKLELILQHFKTIGVYGMESFVSLVPPSASLQNLTSLNVYKCNSLEDVGAFSIVKNLVNLIHLEIIGCQRIVEVVRNGEDLSGSKIVFGNMKRLFLRDLPSLTCFCSLSFLLEFPFLEDLYVENCPNMKIFCGGDIATPNLHKVNRDWPDSIELISEVDVNRAIQQLQEKDKEIYSLWNEDEGNYSEEDPTDSIERDERV